MTNGSGPLVARNGPVGDQPTASVTARPSLCEEAKGRGCAPPGV